MQIILQKNSSEKNRVKKSLTNVSTLTGALRSECSIIDPVFLAEADLSALSGVNYMTVADFERSYFVTGIRSVRDGIVEISGHVDVLSSFATELLSNTAIVSKSENDWNLYINDGTFRIYQNPKIVTKEFPYGFDSKEFVLAIAGTSDAPQIVIQTQPQDVTTSSTSTVYFSVIATGTDLAYQWYVSSTGGASWAISSASGNKTYRLAVSSPQDRDGYMYRCNLVDVYGNTVMTRSATLHYEAPEP